MDQSPPNPDSPFTSHILKTYRLLSSNFLHAPGMIRWIRRYNDGGYGTWGNTTPTNLIRLGWPDISDSAIKNLLEGNYQIEDDVVVVTD